MSSIDDNFRGDHTKDDFREAMRTAPSRPVSAENPIPGLGHDEYIIPALWACDIRRRMTPAMIEEDAKLTREFLADMHGPVSD
ncbi:hypothetical protein ACTXG6_06020 [Pseudonocardia sp. Cha107L01]|uniref:hypothetical protein n=1 Tax=Pseudonocardia sp. Cha107L01 TaxID=3457576 RepID=UPI00403E56F4